MTPKELVLEKYRQARCIWCWPGVWFVMAGRRSKDSIANGGRTEAEAWAKAARHVKDKTPNGPQVISRLPKISDH